MTVLRAQANLGFVANVNRAMAEVRGHVALLNTDTEVPPGWLDRLMHPILTEARIASATPFSNSAATFSFPIPNVVNPLPDGLGLAELDAAFARLSPAYDPSLIAPAGVGFCMGVNLAAGELSAHSTRPRSTAATAKRPTGACARLRPAGKTCWCRTSSSTTRTAAHSAMQ